MAIQGVVATVTFSNCGVYDNMADGSSGGVVHVVNGNANILVSVRKHHGLVL
jgi:hypothetical protein